MKIDDKVRRHLVQCLACFDTPSQAAASVKEEFGIVVTRMQAQSYDPEKHAGRDLSAKWREVFYATRKAFLEDVAKVPIANQTFRLRTLQRMLEVAVARSNAVVAAALLEQAAREVGGTYTNKREIGGPGGGPIPVRGEVLHKMSDDELERIARSGGP